MSNHAPGLVHCTGIATYLACPGSPTLYVIACVKSYGVLDFAFPLGHCEAVRSGKTISNIAIDVRPGGDKDLSMSTTLLLLLLLLSLMIVLLSCKHVTSQLQMCYTRQVAHCSPSCHLSHCSTLKGNGSSSWSQHHRIMSDACLRVVVM
jgi:hypothetical protein